jgi:hypothetical protein
MFDMTHPPYLRAKARELRVRNKMSLDEIAECLSLGKTTVWHWIKDLPDPAIRLRASEGRRRGREIVARKNRQRAREARGRAYRQGWDEFDLLNAEPGFRDFVCMYIGEGYKRSRNNVALGNSDPSVIRLADHWIRRFARNKITYEIQHHADQDPDELIRFWSTFLQADPRQFRIQRKSNSNQLTGRKWRSKRGVLSVRVADTQLRARLQAWIDRVQESWLN